MKKLILLAALSFSCFAGPVQWSGNGHWYEAVSVGRPITWQEAQDIAGSLGGYLATSTSDSENAYLFSLVDSSQYWVSHSTDNSLGPWLGGVMADGAWRWVSGEKFSYTNWEVGQPDGTGETRLEFYASGSRRAGTWNNLMPSAGPIAFIIEWDANPALWKPLASPAFTIQTVAGSGISGQQAALSNLVSPSSVTVGSSKSVYFAGNYMVQKLDLATGTVSQVAGTGQPGFSDDNIPAANAPLERARAVAVDKSGDLYIADGSRVRKVSNGVITTVAGNGGYGFSGDGNSATLAHINDPYDLAVDAAGRVYIVDTNNSRVRRIADGVITTIGGAANAGFSGDGDLAVNAQLNFPAGIALDSAGNLYVSDTLNHRIRKISTDGVITTVAGNGIRGFNGENSPAVTAMFDRPQRISVDAAGNLYIADTGNNRVRMVSNGVVVTVAGTGTAGFAGDYGPAQSALLNGPEGVSTDGAGDVYVSDTQNNRVRALLPSVSRCSLTITPLNLSLAAGGGSFSVGVQADPSCVWSVQGLPDWITLNGLGFGTGPGSFNLNVAGNTGGPRSAALSVGGTIVNVSQQSSGSCVYSLNSGGQAFAASGGAGTVLVTAPSGCSWSVSNSLAWVTTSGSGSGNGSVSLSVANNLDAARSGVVIIAGLPFSVEQAAGNVTGLVEGGAMAQMASGGTWKSVITLVNNGSAPALARLNFYDDNGAPLPLPVTLPQNASDPGLLTATLDRTVAPGASLIVESNGPVDKPTLVGWAQLLTNGNLNGFAVFGWTLPAGSQEAVVPLETRKANSFLLSYDHTGGYGFGVALANPGQVQADLIVVVRDDQGGVLSSGSLTVPAYGHTSFMLADKFTATRQRRGTVEFQTPGGARLAVVGIRANPNGAITTVPPLAR